MRVVQTHKICRKISAEFDSIEIFLDWQMPTEHVNISHKHVVDASHRTKIKPGCACAQNVILLVQDFVSFLFLS